MRRPCGQGAQGKLTCSSSQEQGQCYSWLVLAAPLLAHGLAERAFDLKLLLSLADALPAVEVAARKLCWVQHYVHTARRRARQGLSSRLRLSRHSRCRQSVARQGKQTGQSASVLHCQTTHQMGHWRSWPSFPQTALTSFQNCCSGSAEPCAAVAAIVLSVHRVCLGYQ